MEQSFKEEYIEASKVCVDSIHCPKCKKGDVTIYGYVDQRDCIQTFENGLSVDLQISEFAPTQTIEILDCKRCRIRFIIQSDKDWNYAEQILSLQQQIADIKQAASGPIN